MRKAARAPHPVRLQTRNRIILCTLVEQQPLEYGLRALVAYLRLGSDALKAVVDENPEQPVSRGVTTDVGMALHKRARLPRVIFVR